jgi:hypothetical protein
VPDARRLSGNGRNIFGNLRLNREAEGAEAEAGVGAEGRAAAVMEMDIGNVAVIARPQRGVIELRPNLSCRQAADDNFIEAKLSVVPGRYSSGQTIALCRETVS